MTLKPGTKLIRLSSKYGISVVEIIEKVSYPNEDYVWEIVVYKEFHTQFIKIIRKRRTKIYKYSRKQTITVYIVEVLFPNNKDRIYLDKPIITDNYKKITENELEMLKILYI